MLAELLALRARLQHHGQDHVLRFVDELSPDSQRALLSQVASIDLDWLAGQLHAHAAGARPSAASTIAPYDGVITPEDPDWQHAVDVGRRALAAGRVGVLLVAGGQGTRLGLHGPKGIFPIGPISDRSLFQTHVERVRAALPRYGRLPPLYVMTSPANHRATIEFFERQGHFGLPTSHLLFFEQGLAPAVSVDGKLLMDAKDHVVLGPNGNGGLFAAMEQRGVFAHMREHGVDVISYIQVDNPLSPSCDARFIGYHLLRQSQFSCKAMAKRSADEQVGSYALCDGRLRVLEYTEIPAALAQATARDGTLLYGYSNPGLFIWDRAFAEAQARRTDLPFHRAHKKVPCIDETGTLVQPLAPNGYKFEAFAMDTLPDALRHAVLVCAREAEFAPVKNATGADSPETARAMMTALYARWLVAAGCTVQSNVQRIELSPLYADDEETLRERVRGAPRTIAEDLCLDGER